MEMLLEPGTLYTIESKKCKRGKYPKNDFCYWSFDVKDCIPAVHCDYIDIKGRGKRWYEVSDCNVLHFYYSDVVGTA